MVLPCDGILFDSDGVLVDSDASVRLSWTRWAQRWELDPESVAAMVHGRRSTDTVALLIDSSRRVEALECIDRYEVEDAASVTALPGAAALLADLPRGSWAVVTSGRRPLAVARLTAAGLPVPGTLVCAEDVDAGKPDPAGYLLAASRLGIPPERCLVVEDSPAGVAAGIAAGASVLGVSERALDTAAPVVVRDLAGIGWDGTTLRVAASAVLRQ
jgi:sugar-phosphatase